MLYYSGIAHVRWHAIALSRMCACALIAFVINSREYFLVVCTISNNDV